MEPIFYIDTAIWIDCYENRKSGDLDIGKITLEFFKHMLVSKYKILISKVLIRELEKRYSLEQIRGMMKIYETQLIKVSESTAQIYEAKIIAEERRVPPGDVLHAILARDYNAIMISRDNHFQRLKDICIVEKPETII